MAQIDPREVEEVELGPDGRPIGLDLIRLENTRFGLELLGLGLFLFLVAMGFGFGFYAGGQRAPSPKAFDLFVDTLTLASALLLATGTLACAPTPNGFLPNFARRGLALLWGALALEVLFNWVAPPPADPRWIRAQEIFDLTLRLVPLSLAWILWRFCQHRGLIGRALVWLWLALGWSVAALCVEAFEVFWVALSYPALGVVALVAAHLTARDVWMDAVNRKTKKVVTHRRAQATT